MKPLIADIAGGNGAKLEGALFRLRYVFRSGSYAGYK